MPSFFKKIFNRELRREEKEKEFLKRVEWMFPPEDAHNADQWSVFWKNQIEHGVAGYDDLLIGDDELIKAAHKFGLKSVLCIGNGLSFEAVALSKAGFNVTAMDLSPFAVELCREASKQFNQTDRYFERSLLRTGGTIEFVTGDLFNDSDCPGPYDIVIERRTIQDYPVDEHRKAVASVIARLAERGILLSHCHDNRWNPVKNPDSLPMHATRPFIEENSIRIVNGNFPESLDERIAMIDTSTG